MRPAAGLTRSAAVEYAADGIRVNAVCPGLVWTPMLAAFTAAHPDWLSGTNLPQGRMADPDDIAAVVQGRGLISRADRQRVTRLVTAATSSAVRG